MTTYGPGKVIHINNSGRYERLTNDSYTCHHCGRSYENADGCPGCGSGARDVVHGLLQFVPHGGKPDDLLYSRGLQPHVGA